MSITSLNCKAALFVSTCLIGLNISANQPSSEEPRKLSELQPTSCTKPTNITAESTTCQRVSLLSELLLKLTQHASVTLADKYQKPIAAEQVLINEGEFKIFLKAIESALWTSSSEILTNKDHCEDFLGDLIAALDEANPETPFPKDILIRHFCSQSLLNALIPWFSAVFKAAPIKMVTTSFVAGSASYLYFKKLKPALAVTTLQLLIEVMLANPSTGSSETEDKKSSSE